MGRVKQEYGELWLEGITNGTVNVFQRDFAGNAIWVRGSTLPSSAAGYAVGCLMNKTGAGAGLYVNSGSTSTCNFLPFTPQGGVSAYACIAFKDALTAGGDADEEVTFPDIDTTDYALGQYSVSNDTNTIAELTITATETVGFTASADPVSGEHTSTTGIFRQGGAKAWDIFAAGTATSAGGDASEVVTVTGAVAGDKVLCTVTNSGTNDITIRTAKMTANTLTVVLSGDPSTDATFDYVVFRRAGTFTPSHYIYNMGQRTAVGGDTTTLVITAAGTLATDQIILIHATSDDTDTIADVVASAGAITLLLSADPVTDHSYTYMVIRAFS